MVNKKSKTYKLLSRSLWYTCVGQGCCADELLSTLGSRYDLERFGIRPAPDVYQADLLFISGCITLKALPEVLKHYALMREPKAIVALGSCAISGGPFYGNKNQTVIRVSSHLPVDIFVAGNPPRPEAIMHGILELQKKLTKDT